MTNSRKVTELGRAEARPPTERSGRAKDFGKLSRATSTSSVELFTLALWRRRGATKQALSESRASVLVAATPPFLSHEIHAVILEKYRNPC